MYVSLCTFIASWSKKKYAYLLFKQENFIHEIYFMYALKTNVPHQNWHALWKKIIYIKSYPCTQIKNVNVRLVHLEAVLFMNFKNEKAVNIFLWQLDFNLSNFYRPLSTHRMQISLLYILVYSVGTRDYTYPYKHQYK